MDDVLIALTSTGTFAIAVLGAVLCLMQTRHSHVSRSFAAFLVIVAIDSFPDAFRGLIDTFPRSVGSAIEIATWPSSFLLGPCFWFYVFALTSPVRQSPPRLRRHLLLPGLTIVVALVILAMPAEVRNTLLSDDAQLTSNLLLALAVIMGLLHFTVYPQIAFYLFLILRRLTRFRHQLRDVYASTEQHELRWIYVIGALAALFWLAQVTFLGVAIAYGLTDLSPAFIGIASVTGLALVAATVLWGLRQRPPLMPEPTDPQEPAPPSVPSPNMPQISKYEKSALSVEASERLSRKLRAAMENDHLYRDPNLSLWALARHTGASSNYISQTLNEQIGESFFDFVNGYRVAEAKTLLRTTGNSVLTITYDVGFNARSSFYNAFKRTTGQTPSSYRKKMSQRDELDDVNA